MASLSIHNVITGPVGCFFLGLRSSMMKEKSRSYTSNTTIALFVVSVFQIL